MAHITLVILMASSWAIICRWPRDLATAQCSHGRNRRVSRTRVTLEKRTSRLADFFTDVVASLHHARRATITSSALSRNIENELRRERVLSQSLGLKRVIRQSPPYRQSATCYAVLWRLPRDAPPRVQLPRVAQTRKLRSFWRGSYMEKIILQKYLKI